MKKKSTMPAKIRHWFFWEKLHDDNGKIYYDLLCCRDNGDNPTLKSLGMQPGRGRVTFVDVPRPTTRRRGR